MANPRFPLSAGTGPGTGPSAGAHADPKIFFVFFFTFSSEFSFAAEAEAQHESAKRRVELRRVGQAETEMQRVRLETNIGIVVVVVVTVVGVVDSKSSFSSAAAPTGKKGRKVFHSISRFSTINIKFDSFLIFPLMIKNLAPIGTKRVFRASVFSRAGEKTDVIQTKKELKSRHTIDFFVVNVNVVNVAVEGRCCENKLRDTELAALVW